MKKRAAYLCDRCGERWKQSAAGLCRRCERELGDARTMFERERMEVEERKRAHELMERRAIHKPETPTVTIDGVDYLVVTELLGFGSARR